MREHASKVGEWSGWAEGQAGSFPCCPDCGAPSPAVSAAVAEAAPGKHLEGCRFRECEHEATDYDFDRHVCGKCGAVFIACGPCSVAGGADRIVYHEEPLCADE